MVSMSEFLSGFDYGGQPVIQQGQIDPLALRPGDPEFTRDELKQQAEDEYYRDNPRGAGVIHLNRDWEIKKIYKRLKKEMGYREDLGLEGVGPEDFQFNTPGIYARLLQSAELDGGFLSEAGQNRAFAGQTQGVMGMMSQNERGRNRASAAANLNPIFAERENIAGRYDTLSQVLGQKSQLTAAIDERKFSAQQGFANMLAQTGVQEKLFKVNTAAALKGAQLSADAAVAAGEAAASGSKFSALIGAGATIGAAFI